MKDRLMSFFRYLVFRERKNFAVDAAKKKSIYRKVTESYQNDRKTDADETDSVSH